MKNERGGGCFCDAEGTSVEVLPGESVFVSRLLFRGFERVFMRLVGYLYVYVWSV